MLAQPLTSQREGIWNLQEFVEVANALLPAYLPKEASGRAAEDVNARLVRYYSTEGLLPEARREGREARYVYEHLLALIAVRKLLAEGFGSSAIKQVIDGRSQAELEGLLEGQVRMELVPSGPTPPGGVSREEFLRQVRARAGLDGAPSAKTQAVSRKTQSSQQATTSLGLDSIFTESTWTRIRLLDGLELNVRDDFVLPTNRLGDEHLTQLLKVVLLQFEQGRKDKP